MTTKIDLDELERKARQAISRGAVHDYSEPAQAVTLALIARIRELEAALSAEADSLDNYVGENLDEREEIVAMQVRLRRVLGRGAVLP